METSDLKNILKDDCKNEGQKEEVKVRKKHKKPMQLRDIENRSSKTGLYCRKK